MKASNFLDQRIPDILVSERFQGICAFTNPLFWIVAIVCLLYVFSKWAKSEIYFNYLLFIAGFRSLKFCNEMVPRYLKIKNENLADDWQIKYGEKLIKRRNKLLNE